MTLPLEDGSLSAERELTINCANNDAFGKTKHALILNCTKEWTAFMASCHNGNTSVLLRRSQTCLFLCLVLQPTWTFPQCEYWILTIAAMHTALWRFKRKAVVSSLFYWKPSVAPAKPPHHCQLSCQQRSLCLSDPSWTGRIVLCTASIKVLN